MYVISTGRVVTDLSAAFDLYWNSQLAWPVQTVVGEPLDAARLHFDRAVEDADVTTPQMRIARASNPRTLIPIAIRAWGTKSGVPIQPTACTPLRWESIANSQQ